MESWSRFPRILFCGSAAVRLVQVPPSDPQMGALVLVSFYLCRA